MENKFVDYDFNLSTDGAGIVLYSENAITCDEGEDFFSKEFSTPFKVAEHLAKGDIIGFNTGSSGDFVIKIRYGYPSEKNVGRISNCHKAGDRDKRWKGKYYRCSLAIRMECYSSGRAIN